MNSTSSSSSLLTSVASAASKSQQPLPAKHPSRTSNAREGNGSTTTTTATTTTNGGGSGGSVGSGWGVQWSALQSLSNSVLGSGVVAATPDSLAKQPHESAAAAVRRRRRPTDGTTGTSGGGGGGRRGHSSGSWLGGIPISEADSSRGAGDSGGSEARSRSARRSNINEPSLRNGTRNRKISYKRSASPDTDDLAPLSAPEAERDALAYVHHVKPTDTLEGVVIMYNIHASALRRANGMWPNDSVQRRKILLLPVEDCGVKGKPIDLLNLDLTCDQQANLPPPKKVPTPEENAAAEERGYRHESYVMIDGIGQVEIARLARKKLSHFPPRRRKESVSTNTTAGSGTPPLGDESSVFKRMTPGVGALGGSGGAAGVGLDSEESITKALMELAQGTSAGLENVGGVIEGFVRKWTAKAQDFATHDLIELTQRLGFEIEEEDGGGTGGRNGGGDAGGSGGSRRRAAGDRGTGGPTARGDGRVVRERLPRPRRERGDGAKNGDKLL